MNSTQTQQGLDIAKGQLTINRKHEFHISHKQLSQQKDPRSEVRNINTYDSLRGKESTAALS